MSLDDPLHQSVSPATRTEIIHKLWPSNTSPRPTPDQPDWTAYFAYYTTQCGHAMAYDGSLSSAKTHQDIVSISQLLKDGLSKDGIQQRLRPAGSEEEKRKIYVSITLAVRLIAMVDIADLPEEFSSRSRLPWRQESLKSAMHQYFKIDLAPKLEDEDIKLDKKFTVHSIVNLSGIGVVWTNNIMDHLRLLEDSKKICIFHQVSFLKWLESSSSDIYPDGLIHETLMTLTILFPELDPKTSRHLTPLLSMSLIDPGLSKCGQLKAKDPCRELSHFLIWHDRLAMLKNTINEAETTTRVVRRHLFENRKGDKWFNSWVAMVAIGLTVFFGLVQSIEGGIQVYKAYHPATV